MKELTPEQIQENWHDLVDIVNTTFEGERLDKLIEMYDYFEERMCLAPASGKEHYHNAMAGGYVEHVLHIVSFAKQLDQLWRDNGATINFTMEELVFAALHHDLGKVGDLAEDYYTPNDSEWHRKNQGLIYAHNPKLPFMTVTDRGLFILQHFGIKLTENEYLGLKLTDGMYEEANKKYLMTFKPELGLRSHIARILHQADMMATYIESDEWKRGVYEPKKISDEEVKEREEKSKRSHELFKELFDE